MRDVFDVTVFGHVLENAMHDPSGALQLMASVLAKICLTVSILPQPFNLPSACELTVHHRDYLSKVVGYRSLPASVPEAEVTVSV